MLGSAKKLVVLPRDQIVLINKTLPQLVKNNWFQQNK